uniref:protein-serine/threonine phosphatase n=1 Tax=Aegilops tauschii subsp. strangulata TaxID=200361 RepID=A0A452XB61_AEGTS
MRILSCFGIRARPAQPAPAKNQPVVTASVGVNNVPAAGEGGPRLAPVAEESEGSGAAVRAAWRGAYGAAGKPREHAVTMQDTVSMRPSFCTWVDGSRMHFFAVFDGHGGPVVSVVLRDHMHAILADELIRAAAAYRKKQQQDEEAELCAWKGALRRSFARADELAASGVPPGTTMGSTAVVALVVRGRILVANCGDSRAVLCRSGRAVPLSQDNKVTGTDGRAGGGRRRDVPLRRGAARAGDP